MLTKRIIPCLDVKDGRTVKGMRFEQLRDAGDPVELARHYSDEGADELVLLDISASREGRGLFIRLVEQVAREVQIPLTVGGGIATADDVVRALEAGADKVSVNTACVLRPELITEAADRVGSQAVVAAIDAKRDGAAWRVWIRGGGEPTALDALEWARRAVELGAGELLVTSIDRDGLQSGYDTALLRSIRELVRVPIIASGGAGTPEHIIEGIVDGGADAVLAASILHFGTWSVAALKRVLAEAGIPVRPIVPIPNEFDQTSSNSVDAGRPAADA